MGLEERAAEDPDPRVAELCATALSDLDRAQLSTIHAFGQSLLRTLAAEAGIDPGDDRARPARRRPALRRALARRAGARRSDGPDGPALDRALSRGLTLKGLRELAVALMEREDIAA